MPPNRLGSQKDDERDRPHKQVVCSSFVHPYFHVSDRREHREGEARSDLVGPNLIGLLQTTTPKVVLAKEITGSPRQHGENRNIP